MTTKQKESGETAGERLRRTRYARGMSMAAVAQNGGVHWHTVWRAENDAGVPSAASAHAIAEALGVSIEAIWRVVDLQPKARPR